jgi:hypothetical protein
MNASLTGAKITLSQVKLHGVSGIENLFKLLNLVVCH